MGSPDERLVLADIPERVALREVVAKLEERRDRIAELDLELETVRDQLAGFEAGYHARLAEEHQRLARVEELVRHLERWRELLRAKPERQLGAKARRIDERRRRELGKRVRRAEPEAPEAEAEPAEAAEAEAGLETEPEAAADPVETRTGRLKNAYRALARRFHPDLARTEEERLRFSGTMARINALYKAGDLERLLSLAEQAKGGEIEDPELPPAEQLSLLQERLAWFDAVLGNLNDERAALERSPTCELWRNVQQAGTAGRDLIEELKGELRGQVDRAYTNIADAVRGLEACVAEYNRQSTGAPRGLTKKKSKGALERLFDPYADKRLVRLGLDKINRANVSKAARELAEWLEVEGPNQPHVLRLVLLAYVAELSPFPLQGLERYEDLALRFATLGGADAKTLEQALVEADDLVEFGVRRATDKVAHIGLRFRNATAREAVPVALERLPVRRTFKEVLGVLGDHVKCAGCASEIFAVPLYRLRGLDDLRASVCPSCGHVLSSYWMPKGKDVQAVLNAAFLDFEIVSEWRFRLARGSIAMQLVPCQVDAMTVKDLRSRFYDDVFAKNGIEVDKKHVRLAQGRTELSDKTPLAEIEEPAFAVRFDAAAKLGEADALEMLRHRIRNRFKA
jgi:hypothetical protein